MYIISLPVTQQLRQLRKRGTTAAALRIREKTNMCPGGDRGILGEATRSVLLGWNGKTRSTHDPLIPLILRYISWTKIDR